MTEPRIRKPFRRMGPYAKARHAEPEVIRGEEQPPTRGERVKQAALNKTPERLKNPSDLQVRVRTGAIYIALTVICVLVSNASTAIYLSLLSAICAWEFYYMLRQDAKLPNEMLGVIAAAAFPIAMWLWGWRGVTIAFVIFVLVVLVWYVFWQHARIIDVSTSIFGAIYTGLIMSFAMGMRMALPGIWGGVLVLGLFASIWGNDAFAYLVGSRFGRHKMAPSISPKKSWEGFFAGLAFSMIAWCLMTFIPGLNLSLSMALLFGFVCGFACVLGDLVESRIKRNSGFKDSGTIMPGHGGLLDRCDSQFLVTLVAALLLSIGGCLPNVF